MIKSLLSFILIILLFLASLGFVVYQLQDPEFVVSQAREVNLYGRLAENVGALLPESQEKDYGLTSADITDVLKNTVDGSQFYGFMSAGGNAYLPWLTGKTNELKFSYDLTSTKQKLTEAVAAKIRSKYDNLAICTQSQLRQWSFDNSLPSCQLAAGTLQARSINNQIQQLATKLVNNLPDAISPGPPSSGLLATRDKIALVFKAIYTTWVLTALIILLFLIIYRFKGFLSLAVTFLIVGVLQVAFSLVGWDWIGRTIGDLISGSSGAKSILPIIIDIVSVILGAMKTIFGNISIGFLVTGVVLLMIGIIAKIHQPKFIEKK